MAEKRLPLPIEHRKKVLSASWGSVITSVDCPECLTQNDDNRSVCFYCGSPLVRQPEKAINLSNNQWTLIAVGLFFFLLTCAMIFRMILESVR